MSVGSLTVAPEFGQERQEKEEEEGKKGEERRQREEKGEEAQEKEFKFKLWWGGWEKTQVCNEIKI